MNTHLRRSGTARSQGISQFYLHTPHSYANGMNHTCLIHPSRSWYSFCRPRKATEDIQTCVMLISMCINLVKIQTKNEGGLKLNSTFYSIYIQCRITNTLPTDVSFTLYAESSSESGSTWYMMSWLASPTLLAALIKFCLGCHKNIKVVSHFRSQSHS